MQEKHCSCALRDSRRSTTPSRNLHVLDRVIRFWSVFSRAMNRCFPCFALISSVSPQNLSIFGPIYQEHPRRADHEVSPNHPEICIAAHLKMSSPMKTWSRTRTAGVVTPGASQETWQIISQCVWNLVAQFVGRRGPVSRAHLAYRISRQDGGYNG